MSMIKSFLILSLLWVSCQDGPKVIQPVTMPGRQAPENQAETKRKIHEVVVKEFMDASRYTYLLVQEGDQEFWIAVPYTEVQKGETYYYQGGVLMHNFESKEHDRVFETLYLVNGLSKSSNMADLNRAMPPDINEPSSPTVAMVPPADGGISLTDLFKDPAAYAGKTIKVKGQCVKVNINIMQKNWIHLQDGGKDAENKPLDLTVTTSAEVNIGDIVTFEGILNTNKDFGAGYQYDVILEEAVRQ